MLDRFGRPSWDDYFMSIAMLASSRSIDPRTKHGCVLVDSKHRIVSIGYNGPIRGSIDDNVPLVPDREDGQSKYDWMEHSERNAIFNAQRPLEGCTCYVTGRPCIPCFRALVQSGVNRIVYGPIGSVMMEDNHDWVTIMKMQAGINIKLVEYSGNVCDTFDCLMSYLKTKLDNTENK